MTGNITLERIPHDKQVAVKVFLAQGYPISRICKAVDISHPTVVAIRNQGIQQSNLEQFDAFKKGLIGESYSISQRAMFRITDEKLNQCSAPQLAMVSGVFIDKARDMEGLNRPQLNIVNVVQECKQTATKLEREIQSIDAMLMDKVA